jgi:hypothetical protein
VSELSGASVREGRRPSATGASGFVGNSVGVFPENIRGPCNSGRRE